MRILIVEDETGISGFLKQGLEEESFIVDISNNGKKGLEMALTSKYDLLLLDWMLPGLSGIEICRQFRKEDKETPVIFLTAKDTVDETIFGLQSGANDYIKKPFHFEELLERIKVQLRPKSGDHTIFTLGPIELNTATHQAFKDGNEVSLTLKEFALLEYLIRNKERVCTRTKIIEKVWDINFSYNTGVIDVYINALRRKLNLDQDENYIQTVRGVGYIAKEL
ncbi:response regulator transcription factor [Zunongwangia profunda]|uniref:DNA-binding response regulator n=1 Tax=Zunongwangia profunda TaxID=398743 RepID=A0A3D5J5U6_9FLAO|nr:response regulator transcription factor [Zunongwangia profunda]MAS69382.1 DNA-binding response regulator [Zunongwangia sp.]HAJ82338.1 DNA-binding response regulator [Zunongwangia profunda]HCV83344.1 DNA-binding response regulator [Zunongwangia profunda]|tara:strand:- start:370 stop:1038 length:669 start_codon:yes stop_codon:yes gene_type:complete